MVFFCLHQQIILPCNKSWGEIPSTMLPDLEATELVMNEKHVKKAKVKAKDIAALLANAKSIPKKRLSTGLNEQVPRKAHTAKFSQHCKTNGGPYTSHNTKECHKWVRGKP